MTARTVGAAGLLGYAIDDALAIDETGGNNLRPLPRGTITNFVTSPIPGVPEGLEGLRGTQFLFVQETNLELQNIDVENKYEVLDEQGRRIYFIVETSQKACCSCCCRDCAAFQLRVLNLGGQEIIRIEGDPGCCCDCCCVSNAKVFYMNELIGSVTEKCSCSSPAFKVKDAAGAAQFIVDGPNCTNCYGARGKPPFDIFLADKTTKIGQLNKQWPYEPPKTGLEFFVGRSPGRTRGFIGIGEIYDNFDLCFPRNLDPKLKALLLGAAFLCDFRFFWSGDNVKGCGRGNCSLLCRMMSCAFGFIFFVLLVIIVALIIYATATENSEKPSPKNSSTTNSTNF